MHEVKRPETSMYRCSHVMIVQFAWGGADRLSGREGFLSQVHGILVQLPLPEHINEGAILKQIRVDKDSAG